MNKWILLFLLSPVLAWGAMAPPPPATQAEVNAGVLHNKFVAPDTLAGWTGGGGGGGSSTNGSFSQPPTVIGTNVVVGSSNWPTYFMLTASNQFLNRSGTPLNGERFWLVTSNTASTNVAITTQAAQVNASVYDFQVNSNITSYAIYANSMRKDLWFYTTNLGIGWMIWDTNIKLPELAGAGGITFTTNAGGSIVTISNVAGFVSQGGSGAIQVAQGTGFTATNDPSTQMFNYNITNGFLQVGLGSLGTIQIGGDKIITAGSTPLKLGNNGVTNWQITAQGLQGTSSNALGSTIGSATNRIPTLWSTTNQVKDLLQVGVSGDGPGKLEALSGTTTNVYMWGTNLYAMIGGSLSFNNNLILISTTNETTSAGPNSVAEFTMPNNTTMAITAHLVSATRGGTNASGFYGRAGLINCSNNVATVVGSVQNLFTDIESIASWAFTIDTSAQLVRFRFTGAGTGTNKNSLDMVIRPL